MIDISDDPPAERRTRLRASPRARRAMRDLGLTPETVRGSGPHGRIVEADVRRYADERSVAALPPLDQAVSTPISPSTRDSTKARRAIARVTSASAATVPQFELRAEIDASQLVVVREQVVDSIARDAGVRLSYTDLMLRALALALADQPSANTVWRDDIPCALQRVCVGVVVAMPDGVLIPSLEDADRLSLCETARQRNELVEAARRDRRVPTHGAIAATSLSNLGPSRVDAFSAIIAPPQSSILSVGRLVQRPFVIDGQLCARPTLRLTLTVDHRVLDGAPAAEFLGRIVDYLEAPAKMLYADLGLRTKAEAR